MDRRSFLTLGGAAIAGLVPARLLAAGKKPPAPISTTAIAALSRTCRRAVR